MSVLTASSVLFVTLTGSHFAGRPVREVAGMPRVWSLAVNGPSAAKATKHTERDSESVALPARRGLFHHTVTLGQVMN